MTTLATIRRKMPFILLSFILHILSSVDASPIFFANPFAASTKPPNGESENVITYTTTEGNPNAIYTTEKPTVYQQIARNVLERIASPVVSHFILATEKSSRIVATTSKTTTQGYLEIVDDASKEFDDDQKNTTDTSTHLNESDENIDRELVNPKYVEANLKALMIDNAKSGRIVLYPNVMGVEDKKDAKGEKLEENIEDPVENEVDPDDIVTITKADDRSDDYEGFDDDEETTTTFRTHNARSENNFVQILEFMASIATLFKGALDAIFQTGMRGNRN